MLNLLADQFEFLVRERPRHQVLYFVVQSRIDNEQRQTFRYLLIRITLQDILAKQLDQSVDYFEFYGSASARVVGLDEVEQFAHQFLEAVAADESCDPVPLFLRFKLG